MRNYILDSKYRYVSKTISKGTQVKYKKDGYFYKINKLGNEGFTEYLVTRLLKNSTLPDYSFVDYEYCKINGKLGCRCKDFTVTPSEEFISMNSLYMRLTGKNNLSDYLASLGNSNERLNFILSIVENYGFNKGFYFDYLKVLIQLDLLIENTDRHHNNYGLVYNNVIGRFRIAPIFDNGLSLHTRLDYDSCSCTISGSFTDQVIAFGYPIVPSFRINYKSLYKDLSRIESVYGDRKEIYILRNNLKEYESLFKM